ncbi:MAG: peptidylprolyl isomerase [Myxococcales bacterium]
MRRDRDPRPGRLQSRRSAWCAAVSAVLALACCRRCGRISALDGGLGSAALDAGRRSSTAVTPPPPVWERHVVKRPPLGRQAVAAQIVICSKDLPVAWLPQRARQRTLEQARELAREVAAKARAGDDFTELAVKYSDWPGADRKIFEGYGGRLGLLTEGTQGAPEAYNEIFKLPVNGVSDPVPSSFGLHVFKRLPSMRLSEILITHEGAQGLHSPRSVDDAKALAAKIEGELAAGKSFADEAFADSDDVASAGRGGDIGTFELGARFPAPFREAASGLRVGQASAPFSTPAGLVILERTE